MLAGRFHRDGQKLVVEEIPVPVPDLVEVLVEVKAAGVCLSDVDIIDGSLRSLFTAADVVTLGHEVSGVIHSLGPGLKRDLTVGTRVTLEAGQSCEPCGNCALRRPCSKMSRPLTISEGLTFTYLSEQVRGHYGGTPKSVDELVRLASHSRLDLAPSITARLPLADAAEAVHQLEHKIGDPIRLILVP
jgi:threonine dehydrogenase-like Zn-dependent dehydrogenase